MKPFVRNLHALSGYQFERLMVTVFERLGYMAEVTPLSNDEGRDIIIRKDNEVCVVECKHQKAPVGRPIVQKLHSAATTYRGATGAILITTGRFSDAAIKYASQVLYTSGLPIDLWDRDKLIEKTRRAGVILSTGDAGHDLFFIVNRHDACDFEAAVQKRIVKHVRSSPREVRSITNIRLDNNEYVPAIVVDYDLDVAFQTSVGVVYNPQLSGRVVRPLKESSETERAYWCDCEPDLIVGDSLNGTALPLLFSSPITSQEDAIATEVSASATRHVSYWGRNNQQYVKYCEVRPSDVVTTVKQVIFQRQKLTIQVGPETYSARAIDDRRRDIKIVDDGGCFAVHKASVLCNDCGSLSLPSVVGVPDNCRACGRTLCCRHIWKWSIPFTLVEYFCSECLRSKLSDDLWTRAESSTSRLFGIPGYPLWLSRNWFLMFVFCILAVLLVSFDWRAVPELWACNAFLAARGRRLVAERNRSADSLQSYEPAWKS